jgi:endo-1,4-beta-xylanase
MKNFVLTIIVLAFLGGCNTVQETPETLNEAFDGKFTIGAALNTYQVDGNDPKAIEVLKTHFNSIVAENCMKSGLVQPEEGVFNFDDADKFVALGEENGMEIIGHTLIWHSQAPRWFFVDSEGNDVSPKVLAERMRTHIFTVMGRYKGRVHGWDVVNEAVEDNGELRNSKFLQILGEDYLRLAFEYAREADPDAELYYNDYSLANPSKRDGVVRMIKKLQEQGVTVDAIGMQGHYALDGPSLEEIENSINAFSALGAKVMVTELDVTVLPWPGQRVTAEVSTSFEFQSEYNPFADGMTEEASDELNQRFVDLFQLFQKHEDKISRVTTWGVADHHSWKNNWPVRGRTDYPLLFDRDYEAKPAVQRIIDNATK